jgi:UDP-glucose:(heptosyl)LPS alpha-1,3-glucosyltransferase
LHVQPVSKGIWGDRKGWRKAMRWLGVLTSPRRLTYMWLEKARMRVMPGRRLVFASAPLHEHFKRYYPDIDDISHIIEPGVALPTQTPNRHASRMALGWAMDANWLLLVANDYQRKGLDALLGAMLQLPATVRLAVAGNTRQLALYQTKVNEWGLTDRVTFLGPRGDVDVLMSAADVLAHPTLEDSFGMVVLEAMAHDLPVVVSDAMHCGLSAELEHGKEAWILRNPHDEQEIAQAISCLLADPELRRSLVQGGKVQAKNRSWMTAALKYEEIMQP